MADKISTLILTVDLECCRCYKKIRKVIAKFPEIQSQIFDEKNNKVIVSGPFDPEKLKRKLCCKACKYIIDIKINPPPPEKPKPPEPSKPAPPPKPAEPPKAWKYTMDDIDTKPPPEKPKPPEKLAPPPPKPAEPPKPKPPEKPSPPEKPKPPEKPPPPEKPKPVPPPPEPILPVPGIPVGPYAPMVCCRPCYEGHPEHGICTRFGYERGTCNYKFFSEEDPSCSIM